MPATTPTTTYADLIEVLIDDEVLNELIPEETRIMALYENTTAIPNWEDIIYNQLIHSEGVIDYVEDINHEERIINILLQDPEISEIVQGLLQEGLTGDEILRVVNELECHEEEEELSDEEIINELIRDGETTEEEVQTLLSEGYTYEEILQILDCRE